MPALAISLLMECETWLVLCFHFTAAFSLYPLLEKDGLSLQYIAVLLLFFSLSFISYEENTVWQKGCLKAVLTLCLILHALRLWINAPMTYPFLHDLLLCGFSFLFFLGTFIYLNVRQWKLRS